MFLAFALAIALAPMPQGHASAEESGGSAHADPPAEPAKVPTEEELAASFDNQLIVTYAADAPGTEDSLMVASAEEGTPEEIAESLPSEQATLADLGVEQASSLAEGIVGPGGSGCEVLTFDKDADLREAAARLLSSPDVVAVQPNYVYRLFGLGSTTYYDATSKTPGNHPTNDQYSFVSDDEELNQSYIYTTRIADAWDAGYKCSGNVEIAVIDTGPRMDHPDLAGVWDYENARDLSKPWRPNGTKYTGAGIEWSRMPEESHHSTNVSSILGAMANNKEGIAGGSYNAKVLPIKVSDTGTLGTDALVRAYSYLDSLIEGGSAPSLKVINLSMGGNQSDPAFEQAVEHMTLQHGVLTVASSGNDGTDDAMYPADYDCVLSVMGVNNSFRRASFSNYGDEDISAPSVDITCAVPYGYGWSSDSSARYECVGMSGTSFAAPLAAAVAALCYSAKPGASAQEVRQSIMKSGIPLSDSKCAPFIDALGAVEYILAGDAQIDSRISISKASVSKVSAKRYTGKARKPSPVVKYKGVKLKRGRDYRITYANNKNPGRAALAITGIGRYMGTKRIYFKVVPKPSRVKRLYALSGGFKVKWQKRSACASGYQIRYSPKSKKTHSGALKKGRMVFVKGARASSKKVLRLKHRAKYYVQVRVYKKSSGKNYYSKWSAVKKVRTK